MAEGIARHLQRTGKLPPDLFFASAGTSAYDGDPMADATRAILDELNVSSDGTAKRLSPEMIRRADLVLGMTRGHVGGARAIVGSDAAAAAKIQPLDPTGDIADPIGLGPEAYEAVKDRLFQLIPTRVKEMLPS